MSAEIEQKKDFFWFEECSGETNKGKYQCHMEDIVVACKRLKPGSVGLVPGKG